MKKERAEKNLEDSLNKINEAITGLDVQEATQLLTYSIGEIKQRHDWLMLTLYQEEKKKRIAEGDKNETNETGTGN